MIYLFILSVLPLNDISNISLDCYFPLDLGNYWKYQIFFLPEQTRDTMLMLIDRDTVIDNIRYYHLNYDRVTGCSDLWLSNNEKGDLLNFYQNAEHEFIPFSKAFDQYGNRIDDNKPLNIHCECKDTFYIKIMFNSQRYSDDYHVKSQLWLDYDDKYIIVGEEPNWYYNIKDYIYFKNIGLVLGGEDRTCWQYFQYCYAIDLLEYRINGVIFDVHLNPSTPSTWLDLKKEK